MVDFMLYTKKLYFIYMLISITALLGGNANAGDLKVIRSAETLPAGVEFVKVKRDPIPNTTHADMDYNEFMAFISSLNECTASRKVKLRFEWESNIKSTPGSPMPQATLYITRFLASYTTSGTIHSTTVERVRNKKENYDIVRDYRTPGGDTIHGSKISIEGRIFGIGLPQGNFQYGAEDSYFFARSWDDTGEIKLAAIKLFAERLIDELFAQSR